MMQKKTSNQKEKSIFHHERLFLFMSPVPKLVFVKLLTLNKILFQKRKKHSRYFNDYVFLNIFYTLFLELSMMEREVLSTVLQWGSNYTTGPLLVGLGF
jgi:hypothetical protein